MHERHNEKKGGLLIHLQFIKGFAINTKKLMKDINTIGVVVI